MIILINPSDLNKKVSRFFSEYYADNDLYDLTLDTLAQRDLTGNRCFIIDLDEKNSVLNTTEPNHFAQQLIQFGLPQSVSDIYLISSEISQENSLVVFSHQLARSFKEFHQRTIQVHIATSLTYEISIVVPPSTNSEEWLVYGMYVSDIPKNERASIDLLSQIQNKKLLWHGKDILTWMNEPQQIYNGIAYVWSET